MKNNFFKKMTTSATLLVLSAQNKLVFADDNPFKKTGEDVTKIGNDIKTFSYLLAVVCLIVAGVLFMLGDTAKQKGVDLIITCAFCYWRFAYYFSCSSNRRIRERSRRIIYDF